MFIIGNINRLYLFIYLSFNLLNNTGEYIHQESPVCGCVQNI
jgi:hypothetical protein